jgi:3-oxoacyl-[acyl-carrier-protein] synthase-3
MQLFRTHKAATFGQRPYSKWVWTRDFTLFDEQHVTTRDMYDRINQSVRNALGVPESKVPSNIARYGNTSAATIPILLDELIRDGRVQPGQLLCFLALGAGLNWGAALVRL